MGLMTQIEEAFREEAQRGRSPSTPKPYKERLLQIPASDGPRNVALDLSYSWQLPNITLPDRRSSRKSLP